jgi:hypothetical protein
MNFEDRKKLVSKHRGLVNKSQAHIDEHPFVIAKRKLINKHNDTVKKLLEECTHDEVRTESYYYDGSYLDQAYTEYWHVCELCGKSFESHRVSHGYYG